MKSAKQYFKVEASSASEIFYVDQRQAGFVVPDYKGQFDWPYGNIMRLYCDSLDGFQRLSNGTDTNPHTFLGALIVAEEPTHNAEKDFHEISIALVDGQQRVTTVALLACALCEEMRRLQINDAVLGRLDAASKAWLTDECNHWLLELDQCMIGLQKVYPGKLYPFPRIVQPSDTRGKTAATSSYKSPIGQFLNDFADYLGSKETEHTIPALGKSLDTNMLLSRYLFIRSLVSRINSQEWYEHNDIDMFDMDFIQREHCSNRFDRLPRHFGDKSERDRVLADVCSHEDLHPLIRTIMYASYFCESIVFMRILTRDQSSALSMTEHDSVAMQRKRESMKIADSLTQPHMMTPYRIVMNGGDDIRILCNLNDENAPIYVWNDEEGYVVIEPASNDMHGDLDGVAEFVIWQTGEDGSGIEEVNVDLDAPAPWSDATELYKAHASAMADVG